MQWPSSQLSLASRRRKHECIPAVVSGQESKDIATPLTADDSMIRRLKRRKIRSGEDDKGVSHHVVMSQAMTFSLLGSADVPMLRTRKELWLFRQVHTQRDVPVTYAGFADVVCGLCWAPTKDLCPCGASLVASVDAYEYNYFWNFYTSSTNPLLYPWDPEDQRNIFDSLASQMAGIIGLEAEGMIRSLLALCVLGGLTGRASTICSSAGAAAARGDWVGMKRAIRVMVRAKVPVFRGGQRPGLSRARLPGAIVEMFNALVDGGVVVDCMQLKSCSPGVRRMALFKIVRVFNSIVDCRAVKGVSGYKAKRVIELLALASYGHLCELKLCQSDFRVVPY